MPGRRAQCSARARRAGCRQGRQPFAEPGSAGRERKAARGVSFDLDALMKQAQAMQEQVQKLQEEAANETVSATAGGGVVTVVATAGGEIKEIVIDPKAIDPDDPELLADLILAAVNEALRNGQALLQSKLGEALPPGLGGLLPGL